MEIIGVLLGMRKEKQQEKHYGNSRRVLRGIAVLTVLVFAAGFFPSPATAAGDVEISTRDDGNGITRDPVTGDRGLKTPDNNGRQPEQQGPQTIIVAPEVYPERSGSGGHHRLPRYNPPLQRPQPGRPHSR